MVISEHYYWFGLFRMNKITQQQWNNNFKQVTCTVQIPRDKIRVKYSLTSRSNFYPFALENSGTQWVPIIKTKILANFKNTFIASVMKILRKDRILATFIGWVDSEFTLWISIPYVNTGAQWAMSRWTCTTALLPLPNHKRLVVNRPSSSAWVLSYCRRRRFFE